jgi:hypothetical protein
MNSFYREEREKPNLIPPAPFSHMEKGEQRMPLLGERD